jgi:hypothetical protein
MGSKRCSRPSTRTAKLVEVAAEVAKAGTFHASTDRTDPPDCRSPALPSELLSGCEFDGGFLDEFLDDTPLHWLLFSPPRFFVLPHLNAGSLPSRPVTRDERPQRQGSNVRHRRIQPVTSDIGIITIQNTVSQPLTRRMNTGSPWIDAQSDR